MDELLSWSGFVPLSKLTYCAYLIHLPLMYVLTCASRNMVIYNEVELVST